jgi:chemotaxis protein MotA
MKLDFMTIGGIVTGLVAILGGNILEGGHTESLMIFTAFFIVFGGTLGAMLVQTPLPIFVLSMKRVKWLFQTPDFDKKNLVEKVVNWSKMSRKDGLLALQSLVDTETDAFCSKSLQMLADGGEPEVIRSILEIESSTREARELAAAKVWEGAGGYSPTVGIIGAVMGLIHVMNNLADPSSLGGGIAVAFVATIYGVGLANLLFLPFANKLKSHIGNQSQYYEMVIEGVLAIAEGENPRNIESKLQGYL